MEGISLIRSAVRELEAGRPVAEALVLNTVGSAARHAGARMLLLFDGTLLGTVGGGSPELQTQALCREVLAGAEPVRKEFKRGVVDIACGGSQLIGIRLLGEADLGAYGQALAKVDSGEPAAVNVDWSQDTPVAKLVEFSAQAPSWDGRIFYEPVVGADRCVIFGGGHVGRALVPALAAIDFEVTVYDDRPEVARAENFPAATNVILGSFQDIASSITLTERDYVVVMTHGHVADEDVVAQAVDYSPVYLGCMGSRHKRKVLEGVVASRGATPEQIAALDLPIGLSIDAVTPAEIAVSVAAKMIQVRAAKRGEVEHPCPSGA